MQITFFESETVSRGFHADLDWHELVELLSDFRLGPCTVDNCLGKTTKTKKGCPHKSGKAWTPVAFRDDQRSKANVQQVHALVLDLDNLTLEMQAALPDMHHRAIIHSSHSSKPHLLCIRLVVALSRPVTGQEYWTLRRAAPIILGGSQGLPGLDPRVKSSAQPFFRPSAPIGADTLFTTFDGPPLDVDEALAKARPPKLSSSPTRPDQVSDEDLAAGNPDAQAALEAGELPPIQARVQMAKEFLTHIKPAESGFSGGSRTLGICAAIVRGFLVTDLQNALEAFWDWNLLCKPPWDPTIDDGGPDNIYRKFREAAKADRDEENDVAWGQYIREHRQRQTLLAVAARASLPAGPTAAKPSSDEDDEESEAGPDEAGEAGEQRPTIIVEPGEAHKTIAEAMQVIAKTDLLYVHGAELVTLELPPPPTSVEQTKRDEEGEGDGLTDLAPRREPDSPHYISLSNGAVLELLSATIRWYKQDEKTHDYKQIDPPANIINAIHTRKRWKNIRRITGIISAPQFRYDGSLITEPGWDSITGLYLSNALKLDLDMTPSRDRARRCIEELYECVCDFPFETPIDRTTWLAALLGTLVIPAAGCPPLVTITSPAAGSGKSLLAHAIGVIVSGRRMACTPFTESDEEMRKRYMSHAMAGDQLILIDNVPNGTRFNWPSLDGALTASELNDRMLGTNTIMRAKTFWAWFTTGNNIGATKDTMRRTLEISIIFEGDKPQNRKASDFKHHPYLPWLFRERPRLLRAALELLLAYFNAGMPNSGLKPLGSFETWSRAVRDCLVWAGEDDVQKKVVADLADADPIRAAELEFLEQLAVLGATNNDNKLWSTQILDKAAGRDKFGIGKLSSNAMKEALLELDINNDNSLPDGPKLSKRLRRLVNEWHSDGRGRLLRLRSARKDNKAGWWVEIKSLNITEEASKNVH